MIFRIDDVSLNTTKRLTDYIREDSASEWLLAVMPMCWWTNEIGRPFPRVMTPLSDVTKFYQGERFGVPNLTWTRQFPCVRLAGHGLIHQDHRLLHKEVQRVSILTSVAAAQSSVNQLEYPRRHENIFVPPYNHYNRDTIDVCDEHNVELVRWEDGWKHAAYNKYDPARCDRYYFHTADFTPEEFKQWRHQG